MYMYIDGFATWPFSHGKKKQPSDNTNYIHMNIHNCYFGSYTYQIDRNFDYITINTSKLLH